MPSGGARARSGPAKDPNSLRSAMSLSKGEWRVLPSKLPRRKPPVCPLPDASEAELEMWETYWRKPQSIIWLENGMEIEVALHVRHLVESMRPDVSPGARNLVRQQMDSLLLTHKSMSDAMIRIGEPEKPAAEVAASRRPSARERRLAAVPDAAT